MAKQNVKKQNYDVTPVAFDTGDPYAANSATNYKAVVDAHNLKQSEIDANTIQQQIATTQQNNRSYAQLMEQNQQLFAQTMNQNNALFNVSLQVLSNLAVISAKTVDTGVHEVAQDKISAEIAGVDAKVDEILKQVSK
jgi:hypothetical protein